MIKDMIIHQPFVRCQLGASKDYFFGSVTYMYTAIIGSM